MKYLWVLVVLFVGCSEDVSDEILVDSSGDTSVDTSEDTSSDDLDNRTNFKVGVSSFDTIESQDTSSDERVFTVNIDSPSCDYTEHEFPNVTLTIIDSLDDGDFLSTKSSFCSCMCEDYEGKDYTNNENLCRCPGDSVCLSINSGVFPDDGIENGLDKTWGSYCAPKCFISPLCETPCTPPSINSSPWDYKCI